MTTEIREGVSLAVIEGNSARSATAREVVPRKFEAISVEFTLPSGLSIEVVIDRQTNEVVVFVDGDDSC